jgi:hypothetical protein
MLFSRCNVDLLKIIQLGLTFFNKDGELPEVEFPVFIINYPE